MASAFAPLKDICTDRATPELMELTARLGSMMPYQQAAKVLAEFLPIEPTEKHTTVRKRTISIGERFADPIAEEERAQDPKRRSEINSKCSFPAIASRSASSASTRRMFAASIQIRRETSSSLWPDAAVAVGVNPVVVISSPAAPIRPQF